MAALVIGLPELDGLSGMAPLGAVYGVDHHSWVFAAAGGVHCDIAVMDTAASELCSCPGGARQPPAPEAGATHGISLGQRSVNPRKFRCLIPTPPEDRQ
jgi:hypothetical protein